LNTSIRSAMGIVAVSSRSIMSPRLLHRSLPALHGGATAVR
jgi:hypothetical protein